MVSDLPAGALELEIGDDDNLYYVFHFEIEVTYQSGSTKYGLLHKGEKQIPSRTESWESRLHANFEWKANDTV